MTLQGAIVPRADAAAQQLKALASGLEVWFAAAVKDAVRMDSEADGWLDQAALDDMRAGELPQPFLLRLLKDQPGLSAPQLRARLMGVRATIPLAHNTIPPLNARWVSFGFSLPGTEQNQNWLIESLRRFVSLECVAEVVINRMSIDIMTQ